ncbi:AMP-binding protein [Kribbella sp. NPDC050124]|uniref:AMP-binding protein n=1 Tax=Kribbella sp. NPDC050124 TaxID=3364114 RepID=UPI0037B83E10
MGSGAAVSFHGIVAQRAEARPDDELVRLVGSPWWTAAALWERSLAIAGGLSRYVAPGAAVATCLPPGPEAIAVTTAISALGAVELPLSPDLDEQWVRTLKKTTDCATEVRNEFGRIVVGDGVLLDDLVADGRRVSPYRSAPGDPAAVMTTSGTTGRVKGALLPVAAGPGQAARVQRAMQYDASDVLYSFFSWQHINARHAAFLPAVLSGARLVISPRFSASGFLDTVRAEGITAFNFMGAVSALLLRQPPSDRDRDHLIRRAYGGPAPEHLFQAMQDRFGITLLQAYACTELGDVATTYAGDVRPGAAGRPVPEYELRIAGNQLLVRPQHPHLTFIEYVGDPEATERAWRGGWFHTGDQVRLDDGWLYFEGRSADVVRRRGINISPDAVEDAIATMPGVAEVAVVGVPSEYTEDEVLAIVVPQPGRVIEPADVRRHCTGRLPRHAFPRFVSVEQSLPRTTNLKVSRAELRSRGLPPDAWDAEMENS